MKTHVSWQTGSFSVTCFYVIISQYIGKILLEQKELHTVRRLFVENGLPNRLTDEVLETEIDASQEDGGGEKGSMHISVIQM